MSAQRIKSETFPDAAIIACHLDPTGPELGGPGPSRKSSLQTARDLAADAIALSKKHADRADAADARWQALKDRLAGEIKVRADKADREFAVRPDSNVGARWADEADGLKAALAMTTEMDAVADTRTVKEQSEGDDHE